MKKILTVCVVLSCILALFTGCFGSKKIKATVITNSGVRKEMTLEEIKDVAESNSVLFEDEYVGADISVTATIEKIGGAYRLTSWFDCDAYIKLESGCTGCFFKPITEEQAANYSVGETVSVSGKIGMASVTGFDVYIMKTKISPY